MATAMTLEPASIPGRPLADEPLYEIVNGQRVKLPPMSIYAALITSCLAGHLFVFTRGSRVGRAVVEGMFILDAENDLRRRPDVAFVLAEKWPLDRAIPKSGDWDLVPDLAVEVVSPNDLFQDVIAKMKEYFRFGVRQVWMVVPEQKEVQIYDSPTAVRILTEADELDGGTLLPGFRLPVAAIFAC